MPQQIGEKYQVFVFFEEVEGKEMAEGVGVDEFGIDVVFVGEFLELLCDSARGDLFSEPVDEQETAFFSDPIQEFVPEPDGQVNPPNPASFGVDVDVSSLDMFDLDLHQLTDSGSGRGQCPYNEIPSEVALSTQFILEV